MSNSADSDQTTQGTKLSAQALLSLCIGFTIITKLNPIALRKTKIVYHFGLSECKRVK